MKLDNLTPIAKAIYAQEVEEDPHPEACPNWEDFPDHHDRYVRKAMAAVSAMVPQWQSMENAPLDTEIVVGCYVDMPDGPFWSQWMVESGNGDFGNDGYEGDTPTHWRPAPMAPPRNKVGESSDDLARCLHCGGKAVHTSRANSTTYSSWQFGVDHWVYCATDDCLMSYGMCETKEEAVAGWNRQATTEGGAQDSDRERIKKLEADLKMEEERATDAEHVLKAWFDLRKLGNEQVNEAVISSAKGYLRTSRSGGMDPDLADDVEAVISDMARLSIFADQYARIIQTNKGEMNDRVARAYSERTAAAVALARFALMGGYTAGVGKDDNEDWDDEWRVVLYVDTPAGQVSWHIAPDDQHHLIGLPKYEGGWDGSFRSRDGSFAMWDQEQFDTNSGDQRVGRVEMALCQSIVGASNCSCAMTGRFNCGNEQLGQQAQIAIKKIQQENEDTVEKNMKTTPEDAAQIIKTFLQEVQESHVWEAIGEAMEKPMADPGDVFFAGLDAIISADVKAS